MESIRIIPDLTVQGFQDEDYEVTEYSGPLIVGGMSEGTESGKPVVMLGLEIEDGGWLVKQTTLSLFLTAADALKAKYGDPRTT
jgi:hypothetical protein